MAATGTVGQRIGALAAAGLLAAGVATNQPNEYQEPAKRAGEVTALRTGNSFTVKMPDGKMRAEIHTGAMHFRDENGEWKRPDLAVKARPWLTGLFSEYEAEVTAGAWRAEIDPDSPANYRMELPDGAWLAFDLTTKGVAADLETEEWGVKEYITIERGGPDALTWTVTGSADPEWDGAVLKVPGLTTQALVAWDANRKPVGVRAEYEKGTLTAVVDTAGVAWPVTVDPSTIVADDDNNTDTLYSGYWGGDTYTTYTGARDASSAEGSTYSSNAVGQIYNSTPTYGVFRTFLSFPNVDLTGAVIDSAKIRMVKGNAAYAATAFYLHTVNSTATGNLATSNFTSFTGYNSGTKHTLTPLADSVYMSTSLADSTWIVLNAAGIAKINAGWNNTTRFALLSSEDINNSAPTNSEWVQLADDPWYLMIWYSYAAPPSPGAVTVTPISATSTTIAWTGDTSTADSLRVVSLTGATPDSSVIGYVSKTGSPATFTIPSGTTYYRLILQSVNTVDAANNSSNFDDHYWYNVSYTYDFPLSLLKTNKAFDATYTNARNSVAPTVATADTLGQKTGFGVYRFTGLVPDLPPMNTVASDTMIVTGSADASTTDFDIRVYKALWTMGNTEASRWLYVNTDTATVRGTLNTSAWNGSGANKIPITSTDWIVDSSGDTLLFNILSSLDVAATQPTGNEYVKINPSGAVLRLTWALNDSIPADVAAEPISPDSLRVTWRDRCMDETGYAVVDSLTGVTLATVAADVQSARIGGLLHNTAYRPRVKVLGGAIANQFSVATAAVYTDAGTPTNGPTVVIPGLLLLLNAPLDSLYYTAADSTHKDFSSYGRTLQNARAAISYSTNAAGGRVMNFNGSTDVVDAGSNFIATNAVTVSAWIRPEGWGESTVGSVAQNEYLILRIQQSGNKVRFSSNGGVTHANAANNSIQLNVWKHVTATRAADGTANIYVNGELSGTANQNSGTPLTDAVHVTIGARNDNNYAFDGDIYDVRVFNYILSAAEIAALSAGTLPSTINTRMIVKPDTTGAANPAATKYARRFMRSAGDTLWWDDTADTLRTGFTVGAAWGEATYAEMGGAAGDTVKVEAGRTYDVSVIGISGP